MEALDEYNKPFTYIHNFKEGEYYKEDFENIIVTLDDKTAQTLFKANNGDCG